MENSKPQDPGLVTLAFRVTVDADDLVEERGPEEARRLLFKALKALAGDVEDMLSDELALVDDVPVAVRAVKAVRLKAHRLVSVVTMDMNGRYHTVGSDTQSYCMHALYDASTGLSDEELNAHIEDEEAYDAGLKAFEERWLRERGVTHVIDYEDFGDEREHTLEEYLAQ